MKNLMLYLILALSLTFCSVPVTAQSSFENVTIKATHVRGGVYMLEGRGGNIGVSIGADGIMLIDDQFAPLAEKIEQALAEIGGGELRFVLNTHWHRDHTGGNEVFGESATIIAHENVRKRLTTDQTSFGELIPAKPKQAWPVITLKQSLSVHFNGEEIEAIHYPHGHTDGDVVVFFRGSNVVHMGDDFFSGRFPYVDLDHGGDVENLAVIVQSLIDILPEDVKIIPGHGPLSALDELKAFHRMLVTTTELVRKEMDDGRSLAGIQGQGLPKTWTPWGTGFINERDWIEIVFRSLSEKE